ncbi:hypothetical protein TSA66_24735 [Noviherbaspirillum autotrophicum]|uniref:Uncharacterized protein n=1 Tax=Noviherbaspirillum autotrophicum TaxID=709839 RepID=A0A0C1Y8P9_9BURK|nr:hypothetical protein TSA66_24735 [Noviherbaspirillum autotrophicum]
MFFPKADTERLVGTCSLAIAGELAQSWLRQPVAVAVGNLLSTKTFVENNCDTLLLPLQWLAPINRALGSKMIRKIRIVLNLTRPYRT